MLTQARLKELLHYCQETGVWTVLVTIGSAIQGKVAGSMNQNGYRMIGVEGKRYTAHRLAWFYVHGEWPKLHIDHRDGDRSNCKFSNLRLATHSQNIVNSPVRKDNLSSGSKGISRTKTGKWHVRISLGTFDSLEDAKATFAAAARKLHGEFARTDSTFTEGERVES
jgi:hypothetical protein